MLLRFISGSVPLIKSNFVFITVAFDLTSLLCGSIRRFSLGWAFLARTLPCPGTLIGPSTLRFGIVLAFVAATNAVIALRPSGVATYFARTTDMPTNSGLSQRGLIAGQRADSTYHCRQAITTLDASRRGREGEDWGLLPAALPFTAGEI